jgi:hypothetical protein
MFPWHQNGNVYKKKQNLFSENLPGRSLCIGRIELPFYIYNYWFLINQSTVACYARIICCNNVILYTVYLIGFLSPMPYHYNNMLSGWDTEEYYPDLLYGTILAIYGTKGTGKPSVRPILLAQVRTPYLPNANRAHCRIFQTARCRGLWAEPAPDMHSWHVLWYCFKQQEFPATLTLPAAGIILILQTHPHHEPTTQAFVRSWE